MVQLSHATKRVVKCDSYDAYLQSVCARRCIGNGRFIIEKLYPPNRRRPGKRLRQ